MYNQLIKNTYAEDDSKVGNWARRLRKFPTLESFSVYIGTIFYLLFHTCALWGDIPPSLQGLPYGIYPTSPTYNTERLNYNKRFVVFPQAIFAPTTNDEVVYVLTQLKQYNLPFAVRSGGHCFEPGSLSPDYVIDVSNFNSIIPNIGTGEVYIGAGCLLLDVLNALGLIDYAIPSGECPTVGITGLTLGGGIGLLTRPYGLTCDSVKSITLVNAACEVIEVNESSYPDLFWALRGGGNGSYGIVLGFTFQMQYIPTVTYYELLWEYDVDLIAPLMKAWQSWVGTLPDTISSILGIRHPGSLAASPATSPPLTIRISGLKLGSAPFTEWQSAFFRFNPTITLFTGSYLDSSAYWARESTKPFNKAKSRILMNPITSKTTKKITKFFKKIDATNPDYTVYFEFDALGGKTPDNQTAFFPRNAFGWWYQAYFWDFEEETPQILALSRNFFANIPNEVSNYCYANVVDYDLGKYYLWAYYGNLAGHLIKIKQKYDPANFFNWEQSIPVINSVPGSLIAQ